MTSTPCSPNFPLPMLAAAMTTACEDCGMDMVRHWNLSGTDFVWLDTDGRSVGGTSPIPGVTTISELLVYLLKHDRIALYSDLSARFPSGLGVLPWEHRHRPAPTSPHIPAAIVPECCVMPMQLVRDGWRCRIAHTVFQHDSASLPVSA